MSSSPSCTLCGSSKTSYYAKGPLHRPFWRCSNCQLLFTTAAHHLNKDAEKARYETHTNSPEEPGYVKFLSQAVRPALPYLVAGMEGVDYGCGSGPAIATLLQKQNIHCHNYDPYFFPDWKEGPFDFIFSTETFEHFFNPREEMVKIDRLLKPSAVLIVMTSLWKEDQAFSTWAYARDQTHVCFFHEKTMTYLAKIHNWAIVFNDRERVTIFQKAH